MSKIHQITSFLEYWLKAVDRHSLQAPFIYELYTRVIKNDESSTAFDDIEEERRALMKNQHSIEVTDLGAGSKFNSNNHRVVGSIASNGLTKHKFSKFLFRLSRFINAKNIVELGTSLGINTLYLAGNKNVKVTTFEGSPALSSMAREIFNRFGKSNIQLIEGNINDSLPAYIMQSPPIDLVFLDANHKFESTINYFNLLLKKMHKESCLVIDDIHWSKEMEKAWSQIKDHYSVTLSLDLYQMGVVFFNPDLRKQHYVLEF